MCKYLGPTTYPLAIKRESVKLDVKGTDVVIGDLGKIPDHDPIAEYVDYRPDEEGNVEDGGSKRQDDNERDVRPTDTRGSADVLPKEQ